MTSPDIHAAEHFLAANARVLEKRKFERLFGGGEAGPVRDAVAAYRNPDGGFGQALEPDTRSPGSQPLATDFALRSLLDTDAWDAALAEGACAWLAATAPAGGGAVFVTESAGGWPHAPWMVPEDGQPASLISTGLLAGTLHAAAPGQAALAGQPWLRQATDLLWSRIDALTSSGPYDWQDALAQEADRMIATHPGQVFDLLTRVFEGTLIRRALVATGGRRIEAANLLGIGRNTITRKIQELGLDDAKGEEEQG